MNWLKIETSTPSKPEMDAIVEMCKCSRADAFLAFFRFYCWADSASEDGHIKHLTKAGVDEHSGMQGFAKALERVGWITFSNDSAIISNFERHNGKSAKRRCLDAERKRRGRND